MKLLCKLLSRYYRFRYAVSNSCHREKFLLLSTNLYMQSRGSSLSLKDWSVFEANRELEPIYGMRASSMDAPKVEESSTKPIPMTKSIFYDNTALYLTYPGKMKQS